MDYQTKPISRNDLRRLSPFLRKLFGVPSSGPFPVLEALDHLADVFPGSNYIVVEDRHLPPNTMAQCSPNDMGGMTIEIKDTVYNGAYQNGNGAFRGFICHEICHVFLFAIGYTPIISRTFEDRELPAYCSVEWQAKALCGEVMIPYEESRGMSRNEIIQAYQVSKSFADVRRKQERR
ncbi:MAG: ImmA/IrrE family metallo-endopeptidase [Clostridiales bacterium]|nr:ImmA/IrrE family metallo-endopeptidase [Clostridiales bacterium]